jgi:tetratricopeptide (TPR) repeat protein
LVSPKLTDHLVDITSFAHADGIQVLSNPVNSFELANSLYATGSYSQALKSYESLLQEDVSEYDRNWLLCLSANCYRLQGDRSKAESLYREVISTREKSYAADYSQWFLDHLTNKKQIQEELRLLTGELDTLAPGDSQ